MPESNAFNIDCLEYMRTLPDKFFDLAIVDPPYRDENQPTKDMRSNGGMKTIIGRPSQEYWTNLLRISENQIIWGANNFTLPQWKGFVVWDKVMPQNFTMSMAEVAALSEGLGTISKIYKFRIAQSQDRIHPTQKPTALYRWLLQNYAKPGDKIFDSHMGSQSSRIAAWDMGFDYWGCELDPDYFRDGCKRFEDFKQQLKLEL